MTHTSPAIQRLAAEIINKRSIDGAPLPQAAVAITCNDNGVPHLALHPEFAEALGGEPVSNRAERRAK